MPAFRFIDAWARANRIKVEVEKDEKERGRYLHPEVFGQPEDKGIEWVRHPELMQRIKQMRLETKQKLRDPKANDRW